MISNMQFVEGKCRKVDVCVGIEVRLAYDNKCLYAFKIEMQSPYRSIIQL